MTSLTRGKTQAHRRVKPRKFSLFKYITYHLQAAASSLKQLYLAPLNSILTIGVIAVALALPAGLLIVLQNINVFDGDWQRGSQISLYLKAGAAETEINNLVSSLQSRQDIISVSVISPEEGLQEFERDSGFGSVLQHLPNNPLPTVIEVFPSPSLSVSSVSNGVQDLYSYLQQIPQVDMAKLDMQWLRRIKSILLLGQRAIGILSIFFALAVLLVIGNTIRLTTQQQRPEIEVIKLVGATDAFIRRPFLYSGLYYGLLGGIIACLFVSVSILWLQSPVQQLLADYDSNIKLLGLGFRQSFSLIILGGLLGLCGSCLVVNRHIASIDP